jgi:CcmD family protein
LERRELQFVMYGLAAILTVIFSYVLMLDARGKRLRKELDRVRKMVDVPEKRSK